MIVVKLFGGLGNQIFQYAYGRELQARGHDVKFHRHDLLPSVISNPESEPAHHRDHARYGLDGFNVKIEFSEPTGKEISMWDMAFHPEMLDVPDGVTLAGHWQCEKYFPSVVAELRDELWPVAKPNPQVAYWLEKIEAAGERSVALHVRRGDYTMPENMQYHGVCSAEYYQQALAKIGNIRQVFIFSDDPQWCRENMGDIGEVIETRNRYWDLHLIRQCHNAIIANSSYSWWGAWLGQENSHIIVAPQKWFVTLQMESKDIVPERWIKL